MEGKPETNAACNFVHQSGSRASMKKALKTSKSMPLTSEKLYCGPQQHFLEDVGLGHQHSQCGILSGHTEMGRT